VRGNLLLAIAISYQTYGRCRYQRIRHPSAASRSPRRSLISINRDQQVKLDPTVAPLDQRAFKTNVIVTTRNRFIITISS